MSSPGKDRLDDLASLFLPDLLHPAINTPNVKQETQPMMPMEMESDFGERPNAYEMIPNFSSNQMNHLSSNHINHYASYVPIEAAASVPKHHYDFHLLAQMPQQDLHMPYNPVNSFYPYVGQPQWLEEPVSNSMTPVEAPPKVKRKKRKPLPSPGLDVRAAKLTGLLDFIPLEKNKSAVISDYKIIDKNNKEIKLLVSGFLSGKFFTNELDNSNYVPPDDAHTKDGNVLSCYRRNWISLLINLNLSKFSDVNSKVLKLQTTEYCYIITRVIKWLKIEISARTIQSQTKEIPMIISQDKDKKEGTESPSPETVVPELIHDSTHIVPVNQLIINENTLAIDHFYILKKLQFKNATPHNGNFMFQNYYHLRIKVSAVVADMYYDDYDVDLHQNSDDRNEIVLSELVTRPIIVRGRNPSFYYEKKDILIKSRNPVLRKDYAEAAAAPEPISTSEPVTNAPSPDVHTPESHDEESDSPGKRASDTPVPQPDPENKSVAPVVYSAASANSINFKSIFTNDGPRYKYFPMSNVYYLPPINSVYFPHRAHTTQGPEDAIQESENSDTGKPAAPLPSSLEIHERQRRTLSNVYFR